MLLPAGLGDTVVTKCPSSGTFYVCCSHSHLRTDSHWNMSDVKEKKTSEGRKGAWEGYLLNESGQEDVTRI